jgi:hypothetical protein
MEYPNKFLYPNELPDSVRRQWFWIIKRHTSYTAWQRAIDAYDRLFRKMESLVPELANKPLGTYGLGEIPSHKPLRIWPDWDVERREHQRYLDALARLRRGDKHALGFGSEPVLGGIDEDIYNGIFCFLLGEHPRDGYDEDLEPTIPEKRELRLLAWRAYNLAYENRELTDAKSPPYAAYARLEYNLERKAILVLLLTEPGENKWEDMNILTRYPIPSDLPPVPEPVIVPSQPAPWWAKGQQGGPLIFQSGERVLTPGIYLSEPYTMIHYLNIDAPAPMLNPGSQKPYIDCAWSLIWPDTRYENGAAIPEEEALYFPDDENTWRPKGEASTQDMPKKEPVSFDHFFKPIR